MHPCLHGLRIGMAMQPHPSSASWQLSGCASVPGCKAFAFATVAHSCCSALWSVVTEREGSMPLPPYAKVCRQVTKLLGDQPRSHAEWHCFCLGCRCGGGWRV